MKNTAGGRDTHVTDTDRKKGSEHSHGVQKPQQGGRDSNLTDADRRKAAENPHKK